MPTDSAFIGARMFSAEAMGSRCGGWGSGIRGVWCHPGALFMLKVVSIKQMYWGTPGRRWRPCPAHADGGLRGRYVIVVDEEYRPFRTWGGDVGGVTHLLGPERSHRHMRRCWSGPLDWDPEPA